MLITSMKRKVSKKMLVQLQQLLSYKGTVYLLQMLVILELLPVELVQVDAFSVKIVIYWTNACKLRMNLEK